MARLPKMAPLAVTTCAQRWRDGFTARQVDEYRRAGFAEMRLFSDGFTHEQAAELERGVGVPVVARNPALRTFGNFTTALWETYIRCPDADRFVIGQDDIELCLNTAEYLRRLTYPEKGYVNLMCFRENDPMVAAGTGSPILVPRSEGWCGGFVHGLFCTGQKGRSACLLMFDRDALLAYLSAQHTVDRPQDVMRGHRAIDGGVVTALGKAGYSEWCHYPSLVNHVGSVSSMGNASHAKAHSFPGQEFDALNFLEGRG